jgi:hypothetical protein
MTDDEVFEIVTRDTAAQWGAGQVIDMRYLGTVWDSKRKQWRRTKCTVCALGAHLLQAQPAYTSYGGSDSMAVEFGRSQDWAYGLMDGTDPSYDTPVKSDGDYYVGWLLGQRILAWVRANIHDAITDTEVE